MAKKSISELERRTVNALRSIILMNPGIETKLLRGYLALQLTTDNGRLPYAKDLRLVKLPTSRQIIVMLRRDRRIFHKSDLVYGHKHPYQSVQGTVCLRWFVKERKLIRKPLISPPA